MGTWNWLDWTLTTIAVVSIVTATMKGFIQELISLAAVLVGLAVAALGYQWAALWFEDLTRSHDVALAAGFLTLFLAILVLGALISSMARKLIKTAGLQSFDRILGAIFGAFRGLAVDCILLLALVAFAIKPDAVNQSVLAPYVTTGARVIAFLMPADLKSQFRLGFDKFREALIQQDKKAPKN
ncbi:MAG TPA: CvpA family protein [Terriglobia bacterium]|nr:CvpA family protein [Terriglobia bacterium]